MPGKTGIPLKNNGMTSRVNKLNKNVHTELNLESGFGCKINLRKRAVFINKARKGIKKNDFI